MSRRGMLMTRTSVLATAIALSDAQITPAQVPTRRAPSASG
jgi:hypothetical protein